MRLVFEPEPKSHETRRPRPDSSAFLREDQTSLPDLQRHAGNQAIQEVFRSGLFQAKLALGDIDDPAEREADAVASRIMGPPTGGEMSEQPNQGRSLLPRHPLRQHTSSNVPASVEQVLHAPGRPIDPATRAFFEPRFGHDFGHVRVHDDSEAHRAALALGAKAFTTGGHIAFAGGRHAPETEAGRSLMAHELAHVVQQGPDVASSVRCFFEEVTPSIEAPGLSQLAVQLAHQAMIAGDKQRAIDIVVDEMVRTGQIDRTKLLGGRVHYLPGLVGEGATTRRGFRSDPPTGELSALQRPVRVGDDAFHNLSWLYSSILHEYQHVLQTERPSGLPTIESVVPGQQSAKVHRMQRDVEAYATEIMHAHETGVDQHPADVQDLWERLHDAWTYLSDAQKQPLKEIYRSAHTRAESIPGVGRLRHFIPLP